MPNIRYLGNFDPLAEGKLLFEILSQLRNYGIGRMVYKSEWARRWPNQPSYCIVRKAQPNMDRWLWKGSMHADVVYRGLPLGLFHFTEDLHRSDWKLVHKHHQEQFKKCTVEPFKERTLPKKLPLPPLIRLMRELEAKKEGVALDCVENTMTNRPLFDEEHEFLNKLTKLDDAKNPSVSKDVYNQDAQVYLDLYGQQLPVKVETWATDRVD